MEYLSIITFLVGWLIPEPQVIRRAIANKWHPFKNAITNKHTRPISGCPDGKLEHFTWGIGYAFVNIWTKAGRERLVSYENIYNPEIRHAYGIIHKGRYPVTVSPRLHTRRSSCYS